MNDPWNTTQSRLRKWQKESSTGWELRRVLADSEYFKVIAMCAYKRVVDPPKHVGWQDWWSFYLERLPERQGIQLLLDVWNRDVLSHVNHLSRNEAHDLLVDIGEQSRLSQDFSVALDHIVARETRDSSERSGSGSGEADGGSSLR